MLHGRKRSAALIAAVDADVGAYLDDRMRFVKQGDSRLALAAMHKAWLASGFGMWAHINPDIAVHALLETVGMFSGTSFPFELGGLPHLIYKPSHGAALAAHSDQIRPAELVRLLEEHVAGADPSTSAWVRKHGAQSLAHLDGGIEDGYTYAVGPMTPKKLLLCMRAIADGTLGVADDRVLGTGRTRAQFMALQSGPFFARWLENLPLFNALLLSAGESPVGEVPLRPPGGEGGFLASADANSSSTASLFCRNGLQER